jgi:hypothetical protein
MYRARKKIRKNYEIGIFLFNNISKRNFRESHPLQIYGLGVEIARGKPVKVREKTNGFSGRIVRRTGVHSTLWEMIGRNPSTSEMT